MAQIDLVRGAIIAALSLLLLWMPEVPSAPLASPGVLLGIGLGVQLLLFASRWFARRYEGANGPDGALSPLVQHVGTVVADGLTVLLVAAALFQGISQRLHAL
jgi:hypothetical protein